MLTGIAAMFVFIGFILLPLAWRIRADRRRQKAEILRGDILRVVNRKLGGESLLTVDVVPVTLGRTGRIVLWMPAGYEDLAETVWRDVVKRAPIGYELVVRPGRARAAEVTRRAA